MLSVVLSVHGITNTTEEVTRRATARRVISTQARFQSPVARQKSVTLVDKIASFSKVIR
mgnify:CR=1 FL=1